MPEPPAPSQRILIVDDNANNIAIVFNALKKMGYDLRTAREGRSALEKAVSELPDLILLDVMMPGIDGFETCRRLKASPVTASIPVIFMTGMSETEDKVKGFEAGGIDYLVKPIRLPELRARLTTHLQINHLQRQLQRQNSELKREVQRRQEVEADLRATQAALEQMVDQRTRELQRANDRLAQKIQALQVAEADVQQALVAAEAASEAKSKFLAKMSHEFRTPLNAVLGFSQLLNGDQNLSAKQRQYMEIIDQSGEHLLHLIDGVLNFVQFSSASSVCTPSWLALPTWLQEFLAPFASQALTKNLTCQLVLADDLPPYVSVDATKLQQALWHLLDNAIKFTATGGVTLRADWQAESTASECIQLEFTVEDTGAGMDPDDLQRWCEPFVQTRSNQQPLEGTGIGLTLARQAVALLGGELQVESRPVEGSRFWFTISVPQRTAAVVPEASGTPPVTSLGLAPGQPDYRLLVATQTTQTSQRLLEFLAPLGFTVEIAASIDQLLEQWQQVQPQLVILEATAAAQVAIAAVRATEAGSPSQPPTQWLALIAARPALADSALTELQAACDALLPLAWPEPALLDVLASCLGARYLYRQPAALASAALQPLQAEDLHGLPTAWLQALHSATVTVDDARVRALIHQLGPERADLQRQLEALAEDFRFDRLFELLQSVLS